eukprot:4387208-Lingulodinium_polyedra.AAC.1
MLGCLHLHRPYDLGPAAPFSARGLRARRATLWPRSARAPVRQRTTKKEDLAATTHPPFPRRPKSRR